ncbi:MAG: helix-hairpin-helix domain-containing protein [Candidatus Omnitrophica bacterium]|nr:helix-hairpin-helix domain-containing protein [Candidatus Omnitrophota bacterium]
MNWVRAIAFMLSYALVWTSCPAGYEVLAAPGQYARLSAGKRLFNARSDASSASPRPLVSSPREHFQKHSGTNGLAVPPGLGRVAEVWQPEGVQAKGMLFYVQDVHAHSGAQTHIAALVKFLSEASGIKTVALEGGEGHCPTEAFSNYPSPQAVERVAQLFLNESLFTGPEYFAVVNPGEAKLYGVEDSSAYREHLLVHQKCGDSRSRTLASLSIIQSELDALKESWYPEDLRNLQEKRQALNSGNEAAFEDYVEALLRLAQAQRLDLHAYPQVAGLGVAARFSKELKEQEVKKDIKNLLGALTPRLNGREIRELKDLINEGQKNELSLNYYCQALGKLAYCKGLRISPFEPKTAIESSPENLTILREALENPPVSRFPVFSQYVVLHQLQGAVHSEEAFQEMRGLERSVEEASLNTEGQKILHTILSQAEQIQGLATLSLSPEGWTEFRSEAERGKLSAATWETLLRQLNLWKESHKALLTGIFEALPDHERYYELANERDRIFAANTLELLRRQPKRGLILVTGGFHTPGVTQRLREQDIAYAVIAPRFEGKPDDRVYESRLRGEYPSFAQLSSRLHRQALGPALATWPGNPGSAELVTQFLRLAGATPVSAPVQAAPADQAMPLLNPTRAATEPALDPGLVEGVEAAVLATTGRTPLPLLTSKQREDARTLRPIPRTEGLPTEPSPLSLMTARNSRSRKPEPAPTRGQWLEQARQIRRAEADAEGAGVGNLTREEDKIAPPALEAERPEVPEIPEILEEPDFLQDSLAADPPADSNIIEEPRRRVPRSRAPALRIGGPRRVIKQAAVVVLLCVMLFMPFRSLLPPVGHSNGWAESGPVAWMLDSVDTVTDFIGLGPRIVEAQGGGGTIQEFPAPSEATPPAETEEAVSLAAAEQGRYPAPARAATDGRDLVARNGSGEVIGHFGNGRAFQVLRLVFIPQDDDFFVNSGLDGEDYPIWAVVEFEDGEALVAWGLTETDDSIQIETQIRELPQARVGNVSTADGLGLRIRDSQGVIVGGIPSGTPIEWDQEVEPGDDFFFNTGLVRADHPLWLSVSSGDVDGWVSATWVDVTEEASTAAPADPLDAAAAFDPLDVPAASATPDASLPQAATPAGTAPQTSSATPPPNSTVFVQPGAGASQPAASSSAAAPAVTPTGTAPQTSSATPPPNSTVFVQPGAGASQPAASSSAVSVPLTAASLTSVNRPSSVMPGILQIPLFGAIGAFLAFPVFWMRARRKHVRKQFREWEKAAESVNYADSPGNHPNEISLSLLESNIEELEQNLEKLTPLEVIVGLERQLQYALKVITENELNLDSLTDEAIHTIEERHHRLTQCAVRAKRLLDPRIDQLEALSPSERRRLVLVGKQWSLMARYGVTVSDSLHFAYNLRMMSAYDFWRPLKVVWGISADIVHSENMLRKRLAEAVEIGRTIDNGLYQDRKELQRMRLAIPTLAFRNGREFHGIDRSWVWRKVLTRFAPLAFTGWKLMELKETISKGASSSEIVVAGAQVVMMGIGASAGLSWAALLIGWNMRHREYQKVAGEIETFDRRLEGFQEQNSITLWSGLRNEFLRMELQQAQRALPRALNAETAATHLVVVVVGPDPERKTILEGLVNQARDARGNSILVPEGVEVVFVESMPGHRGDGLAVMAGIDAIAEFADRAGMDPSRIRSSLILADESTASLETLLTALPIEFDGFAGLQRKLEIEGIAPINGVTALEMAFINGYRFHEKLQAQGDSGGIVFLDGGEIYIGPTKLSQEAGIFVVGTQASGHQVEEQGLDVVLDDPETGRIRKLYTEFSMDTIRNWLEAKTVGDAFDLGNNSRRQYTAATEVTVGRFRSAKEFEEFQGMLAAMRGSMARMQEQMHGRTNGDFKADLGWRAHVLIPGIMVANGEHLGPYASVRSGLNGVDDAVPVLEVTVEHTPLWESLHVRSEMALPYAWQISLSEDERQKSRQLYELETLGSKTALIASGRLSSSGRLRINTAVREGPNTVEELSELLSILVQEIGGPYHWGRTGIQFVENHSDSAVRIMGTQAKPLLVLPARLLDPRVFRENPELWTVIAVELARSLCAVAGSHNRRGPPFVGGLLTRSFPRRYTAKTLPEVLNRFPVVLPQFADNLSGLLKLAETPFDLEERLNKSMQPLSLAVSDAAVDALVEASGVVFAPGEDLPDTMEIALQGLENIAAIPAESLELAHIDTFLIRIKPLLNHERLLPELFDAAISPDNISAQERVETLFERYKRLADATLELLKVAEERIESRASVNDYEKIRLENLTRELFPIAEYCLKYRYSILNNAYNLRHFSEDYRVRNQRGLGRSLSWIVTSIWGMNDEVQHARFKLHEAVDELVALGNEIDGGLYTDPDSAGRLHRAVVQLSQSESRHMGTRTLWIMRKLMSRGISLVFAGMAVAPIVWGLIHAVYTGQAPPSAAETFASVSQGLLGVGVSVGLSWGAILYGRYDQGRGYRLGMRRLRHLEQRLSELTDIELRGPEVRRQLLRSEIVRTGEVHQMIMKQPESPGEKKPVDLVLVMSGSEDSHAQKIERHMSDNHQVLVPPGVAYAVLRSPAGTAGSGYAALEALRNLAPEQLGVLMEEYPELQGRPLDDLNVIIILADGPDTEALMTELPFGDAPGLGRPATVLDYAFMNAYRGIEALASEDERGLVIVNPDSLHLGAVQLARDQEMTLVGAWASHRQVDSEGLGVMLADGNGLLRKLYDKFDFGQIRNWLERRRVGRIFDLRDEDLEQMVAHSGITIMRLGEGRGEKLLLWQNALRAAVDNPGADLGLRAEDAGTVSLGWTRHAVIPRIMAIQDERIDAYIRRVEGLAPDPAYLELVRAHQATYKSGLGPASVGTAVTWDAKTVRFGKGDPQGQVEALQELAGGVWGEAAAQTATEPPDAWGLGTWSAAAGALEGALGTRLLPAAAGPSDGSEVLSSAGALLLERLNEAVAEDFQAVPGVTAGIAERIVMERGRTGGFETIAQLTGVKGIGPARLILILRQVAPDEMDQLLSLLNSPSLGIGKLREIPGIGRQLAREIVLQRKENDFESMYDLMTRVKGIGFNRMMAILLHLAEEPPAVTLTELDLPELVAPLGDEEVLQLQALLASQL